MEETRRRLCAHVSRRAQARSRPGGAFGRLGNFAQPDVLVGLVRSATVHYWSDAELFSIYAVMAVVLIARPKGLFAALEARKI